MGDIRISNQIIAHEVLERLKSEGYEQFTARPWNYFKPDTTLWWLVPSKEWPSFMYGKLVLFRNEAGYRVGFHIEKGISETAGQMLSSKRARKLCLKADWAWNGFIDDLASGRFETGLKEVTAAAKKPLRISLRASNVTTEYDPYSEKIEGLETDHSMVFLYEDGNLRGLPDELKGEMRKYGSCSSLSGLKTILAGKELEWFWIDLYVVLHVEADNRGQIPDLALIFIENWADLFGINSK